MNQDNVAHLSAVKTVQTGDNVDGNTGVALFHGDESQLCGG